MVIPLLRFADFELDRGCFELRRGDRNVKLEKIPFELLILLMERGGQLVTRQEIVERLWGRDVFLDTEHGINTAVRKVRQALGDDPEQPRFVQTVTGKGYRFIAPLTEITETRRNGNNGVKGSGFLGTEPRPEFRTIGSEVATVAAPTVTLRAANPVRSANLLRTASFAILAVSFLAVGFGVYKWSAGRSSPLMRPGGRHEAEMWRLSFGRGMIRSARFAPGGTDVIYGANWDGKPFQMFSVRSDGTESHSLSQQSLDILAVSPKGQLAVSLDRHFSFGLSSVGTLALMRSADAEPQPLLTNVQDADWSPSGDELAITHYVDDRSQLEFPVGTVVYQAVGGGWISHSRISPDGKSIAFLEHPLPGDSAGYLAVVDLAGNKRRLSGDFADVQGLAWDPSGQAVLFSGAEAGPGTGRSIYKTTLDGKQTLLRHDSTQLMLQDVSGGGQILISRDIYRQEVFGRIYPDKQERNLGWQDNSYASYLSDDARTIVLSLQGEAAGSGYEVYIRGTGANATAIRLGEGVPASLSPDGKWVLAIYPWGLKPSSPPQLTLLPVGLGKPKALTDDARSHDWGTWLPDGRILFLGSESGHGLRNWVMNSDGTQAHPITPEGTTGTCVSAQGELLAADPAGRFWLYPVNGDNRRSVSGMSAGDSPSRWSKDESTVYVAHPGRGTTDVYVVNLVTGWRTLLYRLTPTDRAGVTDGPSVQLTPDGRSYAYSYVRILSDLYSISSLN